MVPARIALAAAIPLAVGGCAYIAGINEPPQHGYAHITIPRLDHGRLAVNVFSVHSKKGLFATLNLPPDVHEMPSFALRPGGHVLELACLRPDAVSLIDEVWTFDVTVEANQNYTLDCAPAKVRQDGYFGNHFSLTPAAPEK